MLMVSCIVIAVTFVIGMKWQELQHNDMCVDMGGETSPAHGSICVLTEEKTVEVETRKEKFILNEASQQLVGRWKVENDNWGFVLYEDGTASSINAMTLIYQQWRIDADSLCLTARSIGLHVQSVSESCRSYRVTGKDQAAVLILNSNSNSDFEFRYTRD